MPASPPEPASAPVPLSAPGAGSEGGASLVLGIDPGLITCGWGLVRAGPSPAFVACGAIKPRARDPITRRLLHLHDSLTAVMAEYRPDEVAIEEQFVRALAPASALAIGQARAAGVLAAARAGLEVSFYSPASIKSAVAGYGQSDKRQVQAMVRLLLHLEADPEPADAADALAIALCHLASRRVAAMTRGR